MSQSIILNNIWNNSDHFTLEPTRMRRGLKVANVLQVLANPLDKIFWLVTYHNATFSPIQDEHKRHEHSLRNDLIENNNDSIDIYSGTKPLEGVVSSQE